MDSFWFCSPRLVGLVFGTGETPFGKNSRAELERAGRAPCPLQSRRDSARRPDPRIGHRLKGARGSGECKTRTRRQRMAAERASREKGSIVLQLVLIWLPVLAIFGVILWLRVASIHHTQRQRSLDRCVVNVLRSRCETLNQLSKTNLALRQLVHVLAVAELAKTATAVIPVVGQLAAVLGEMPLVAVRAIAQGIARLQDGLITFQKIRDVSLWRCGLVLKGSGPLTLERPPSWEAQLAMAPAPLEWSAGNAESELDVRAWQLAPRSFGYCHTRTEASSFLNGEAYDISLRRPQWKSSSSWP
jgi:cell division protein FtsB